MMRLTEPHNTARETPAPGPLRRPACPSGSWGAAERGMGAETVAPRKAGKSHAIHGRWPVSLVPETGGAYQIPVSSKGLAVLAWVGESVWGPFPSPPAPLLQLPPPLHQEALPLTESQPSMEEWPLFLLREEASMPPCPFSHPVPGF